MMLWAFPECGLFPMFETAPSPKQDIPRDCDNDIPMNFQQRSLEPVKLVQNIYLLVKMQRVIRQSSHRGMLSLIQEIVANILAAVTSRYLLGNHASTSLGINAPSRQKHSSSKAKDSNLPSTIRKSTSVVEHVL
jgi:hypothetical protein